LASWPELALVAISPTLFLLWFFYHQDRYKHVSRWLMIKVFLTGAFTVLLAIPIELIGGLFFPQNINWVYSALFFFVVVGPTEETMKYAAVKARAYYSPLFDEPMDGIIFGVSAALGFATVENMAYVLQNGLGTGIVRDFISVPGHAFFGAVMGFYLGQAKYLRKPNLGFVGLALAAMLHGTFDTVATITSNIADGLVGIAILAGFVWILYFKVVRPAISEAERESPYKNPPPPYPV
jgi:RsiW-degrading membrane proteinase PrsW (M82 family)